jgi:hypothetical protein
VDLMLSQELQLLGKAISVLAVPITDETRHLIGERAALHEPTTIDQHRQGSGG